MGSHVRSRCNSQIWPYLKMEFPHRNPLRKRHIQSSTMRKVPPWQCEWQPTRLRAGNKKAARWRRVPLRCHQTWQAGTSRGNEAFKGKLNEKWEMFHCHLWRGPTENGKGGAIRGITLLLSWEPPLKWLLPCFTTIFVATWNQTVMLAGVGG